jgi:hypothetical protein
MPRQLRRGFPGILKSVFTSVPKCATKTAVTEHKSQKSISEV